MYLKSITIKGFKSFPDRTRLEFGPGTSVIVGPNGSGKSNVTDAILWALGEQSPLTLRAHSMQDVIFGGAPGRQAASSASVELVLDDSEGVLGLGPEVAVHRRLDRTGDGEYRIGGARCRLIDVLELLSDTGLGKEMHSVVSQGRVEAVVTSKPYERRLLIEEAAGLGKHRKRRRRAQLKLGHTQENLDRALDVEREARARLKPLKRQAEAAQLHDRLRRQMLEVRWELAREELRARSLEAVAANQRAAQARAARHALEQELERLAARRAEAEEALAAHSSRREELSRRSITAQSAADRVGDRADAIRAAGELVARRLTHTRQRLQELRNAARAQVADPDAVQRIAALRTELEALERDREAEIERQLEDLERQRREAAELEAELVLALEAAATAREQAESAAEAARKATHETDLSVERARRDAARIGGELAAVNQFLRSNQGAPGGARSLADSLTVSPGYELAVAAALDGRLSAAVLEDRASASALLDRAGRDGGRVFVLGGVGADRHDTSPPLAGAVTLRDHVAGDDEAASIARELLADVWVVDDVAAVGDGFMGVVVTRDGRVWSAAARELRQAAKVGQERVLAERNRREQLLTQTEAAAQLEHDMQAQAQSAAAHAVVLESEREAAVNAHRAAVRARDEAAEQQRRLVTIIDRRRNARDEGPGAGRIAQLTAELEAEQARGERAERERSERLAQIRTLEASERRDLSLEPQIAALAAELRELIEAIRERRQQFDTALEADRQSGAQLTGRLRACAQEEAGIQGRLRAASEALTAAEVGVQRAGDKVTEAQASLGSLAAQLQLQPTPGQAPLEPAERERLQARLERLIKRREQLGPINPLAEAEYAEALARVDELEAQRRDLEAALRELEGLIKDTDREIRDTFERTFEATGRNFEELAARVFPGGSGRLRLVGSRDAQASMLGGGSGTDPGVGNAGSEDLVLSEDADDQDPDGLPGVEIEITPAGKAMKRLTLLSGGEKSMTALAFLFAVFLARPCPFYVLDEVEAALDDLNITRFLDLLEAYNHHAQFIVVTHQKRTMEAADSLYGVSMGGDGVSRVISRRLPAREAA